MFWHPLPFISIYSPTVIEKYRKSYQNALDASNASQRRAIETIDGPVLVIAGPGTGKTQILALRIGNIIRTTDAKPQNILCLTFTEAGAIAMRQRLLRFIGPSAYDCHIYTFHAFANQLIQDNPEIFGGYKELAALTDLEKVDVYRSLIDQLPKDHVLKRFSGNKYFEAKRLENLFFHH